MTSVTPEGVEVGSLSWTRRLARFRINVRDELKAAGVPAPSPTIESAQTADTEYHHVPTVGRHLQVHPALGFTFQVGRSRFPKGVPDAPSPPIRAWCVPQEWKGPWARRAARCRRPAWRSATTLAYFQPPCEGCFQDVHNHVDGRVLRTCWFCAAEFPIDGALGLLLLLGASGHRGSAWRAVPNVFCGVGLLIEGLI